MAQQPTNNVETIEITNFGGRLTRVINGDLNSGFANFTQSWGYDPFTKPQNLTWLEQPTVITASIVGNTGEGILAGKHRFESSTPYVYSVGTGGHIFKIKVADLATSQVTPNFDSVIAVSSVNGHSQGFNYGASIDFYGNSEKIFVGDDFGVTSINFDGSAETQISPSGTAYAPTGHILKQFAGKLRLGNGNTIATIDANTNTVTSSIIGTGQGNLYSELNPPLPTEVYTHDLDTTTQGDYLQILTSNLPNENILTLTDDGLNASGSGSTVFKWNGSDLTQTSSSAIPSYAATAMQTYLQNEIFFSNDSFGASMNDGTSKILTLTGNKSALPNATAVNGNFVTWVNPETNPSNSSIVGSLYYFGSLDSENPVGLYRLMRYSPSLISGNIYQMPFNLLTGSHYMSLNNSASSVQTAGYGKHYFSTIEKNSVGSTAYNFLRFLITSTGTGTPQLGMYQTQTQLFSKKKKVVQVRVYCEPTISGNGFQIDYIGSDGNVITGSSSTYTFTAGTDPTKNQGSLDRLDFNPGIDNTYALGIRITNTGTTNMTIHKIEVDITDGGK